MAAIQEKFQAQGVMEGAGVALNRVFGNAQIPKMDPFLLLDDFRSSNPPDYLKGFPWHPHRGIETVTYMLNGTVEHGDSMGNKGVIRPGGVQWMTAGSGIIHQEMPKGDDEGLMEGFQLWVNLPAKEKMCLPKYRDIDTSHVRDFSLGSVPVRLISGEMEGHKGPMQDISGNPVYADITVPARYQWTYQAKEGRTLFLYIFEGSADFGDGKKTGNHTGILFDREGGEVTVSTEDKPVRFMLIEGRPLGEPVAWAGPIVMNTQQQLETAFNEFNSGTFIKEDVSGA